MSNGEFADGLPADPATGNDGTPEQDSPETVPKAGRRDVDSDVESDPALNDGVGQDWTDEGGATPGGAATSSS